MNIIILEFILLSAILTWIIFSSDKLTLKEGVVLIIIIRLILNYIIRVQLYQTGSPTSFDERISRDNLYQVYHGLLNFKLTSPGSIDGYGSAYITSVLLFLLGGYERVNIAILIWTQLCSLILSYGLYLYIKDLNQNNRTKLILFSLILFMDWIIFPTTDFRPENLGLALSILLLTLRLKNDFRSNFQINLLEGGLLLAHFLSFFFYVIIMVLTVNMSQALGEETNFGRWNLAYLQIYTALSTIIYHDIYNNRAFGLSKTIGFIADNQNMFIVVNGLKVFLVVSVVVMANTGIIIKLIQYLIRLSTKFVKKYNKLIHNILESRLSTFTVILGVLFILTWLITRNYAEDIEYKGWTIIAINLWKLIFLFYVLYWLKGLILNKSWTHLNQTYSYQVFLVISVSIISLVLTPIIFLDPTGLNVHIRIFPIVIFSWLGLLIKDFDLDDEKKSNILVILICFTYYLVNIVNGSTINVKV